jgi:hypothetical protein
MYQDDITSPHGKLCPEKPDEIAKTTFHNKRNYYQNSFKEIISTKATQEHRWEKLGEHIMFYSSKQYFFVAGVGLSNTSTSTVLAEQVTYLGQTSTLHELLTSKRIFSFIQHSRSGGCKIICQHDDPTIT